MIDAGAGAEFFIFIRFQNYIGKLKLSNLFHHIAFIHSFIHLLGGQHSTITHTHTNHALDVP